MQYSKLWKIRFQLSKKAYAGSTASFLVIDIPSKTVIDKVNIGGTASPYTVAITPNGKQAYMTGHGRVSIVDTETDEIVKTISVGDYNHAIAISPDGTQAYVTHDGSVSIIDTEKQAVTATITVGEFTRAPGAVAFTPNGKQAYVANEGKISIIDTAKREIVATIDIGEFLVPSGVVFTPNGKRAYVAQSTTKGGKRIFEVTVIDTATDQITKTIPVEQDPAGIAITSDGREVYVTNFFHDIVSVIDTQTNRVRHTIPVGESPYQITMAPNPQ
jgi:YVTN family beta-propeller protein